MKNKLNKADIIGFFVVSVLGIINHYLYDICNKSTLVALFCPVNESPWEHLKLLFFPFILFAIIEYQFVKNKYPNFFSAKAIGILTGMLATIMFFYTYSGIIGKTITPLDILSFFVGVITAFVVSRLVIKSNKFDTHSNECIAVISIIFFAILFVLCTFFPPQIPLFKDPQQNYYGILF